jgi:hypothetical protein
MINLKWRACHNADKYPPKRIKLEIPGWAGIDKNHSNGAVPQPWHCPPFVEGSTYGLELIYPFDSECVVENLDGNIVFNCDFSKEVGYDHPDPPFKCFAPGHFGFTSSFDFFPPKDHIIRIEPHPKYFTDHSWTTPLPVPGHIQGEWWTKIFFVVFKEPPIGGRYIFRKGEPYAQILILPKKVEYKIEEMTSVEKTKRMYLDNNSNVFIKESWKDHKGNVFDDKYRNLGCEFAKGGIKGVCEKIDNNMNNRVKINKKRPILDCGKNNKKS